MKIYLLAKRKYFVVDVAFLFFFFFFFSLCGNVWWLFIEQQQYTHINFILEISFRWGKVLFLNSTLMKWEHFVFIHRWICCGRRKNIFHILNDQEKNLTFDENFMQKKEKEKEKWVDDICLTYANNLFNILFFLFINFITDWRNQRGSEHYLILSLHHIQTGLLIYDRIRRMESTRVRKQLKATKNQFYFVRCVWFFFSPWTMIYATLNYKESSLKLLIYGRLKNFFNFAKNKNKKKNIFCIQFICLLIVKSLKARQFYIRFNQSTRWKYKKNFLHRQHAIGFIYFWSLFCL